MYFYSIGDCSTSDISPSDRPRLKISDLPSNTRLVFQIILIPEPFSILIA